MPGSTTVTHYAIGALRRIQVDFTADAAAATIPDTVLPSIEGKLVALETNPGATAPTDNYDITVEDAEGVDKLAGAGANRDTANTEQAAVAFASSSVPIPVDADEVLTMKFANNAVNSAVGRVILFYIPAGAN